MLWIDELWLNIPEEEPAAWAHHAHGVAMSNVRTVENPPSISRFLITIVKNHSKTHDELVASEGRKLGLNLTYLH